MRTMFFLLMLLGAAPIATAGNDAGVIVTGEATLQPQLVAQIEEWLRDHGHSVVAAPMPVDAINTMIDCFVLDSGGDRCARGVVNARARVNAVVFTTVEVAPTGDGMRNVTLIAYWFQKGEEVTARKRTCERCTGETLRTETDALMAELAKSRQHGSGLLRVSSEPPGATVIVDKERVGVTPLEHNLTPGNHQVTLMLDRHETEQRRVAIRLGDTTPLNVPLIPTRERGGSWVRWVPAGLVAGGVAMAATGGILWWLDEDDSPTGPLYYRDTARAGVTLLAVGVATTAVGAAWWLKRSASSGPVASLSHDGASIGWWSTF